MHRNSKERFEESVIKAWYQGHFLLHGLRPLSWLFRSGVWLRRYAYQSGLLPKTQLPVPVIVVGNISLGGTGKTPLVCWIVDYLKHNGYTPGVVSKGYGGQVSQPEMVKIGSDPKRVGEEPVLIAKRCNCPVVVGKNRVEAAWKLLDSAKVDVIISDDGLQHYRLERDIEIAVIDGMRRHGNGCLLPAGPLREPKSRMGEVDFIVANGQAHSGEYAMKLQPGLNILPVSDDGIAIEADSYKSQTVYGVAGIGHPERFYQTLRGFGMVVIEKRFKDHHSFTREDFAQLTQYPILMTEKDAIKCRNFAKKHWGFIPVKAILDSQFGPALLAKLEMVAQSKQPKRASDFDFVKEGGLFNG